MELWPEHRAGVRVGCLPPALPSQVLRPAGPSLSLGHLGISVCNTFGCIFGTQDRLQYHFLSARLVQKPQRNGSKHEAYLEWS